MSFEITPLALAWSAPDHAAGPFGAAPPGGDALVPLAVPIASSARTVEPPPAGSRRRRLWALDGHAHCPVIGACLPLDALRRLASRTGDALPADDYELHVHAVAECKRRTTLAEAVQRELDRRSAVALRRASAAKTVDALAAWWRDAAASDLAGALWATLTHPRCDAELERRVLGDVHMLQHQVGMAQRVDVRRFDALVDEHAALQLELQSARRRLAQQAHEHARRDDAQRELLMRLRAEVMARDTAIAALRDEVQALQPAPGARSAAELRCEVQAQAQRIERLERLLRLSEREAHQARRRAEALTAAPPERRSDAPTATPAPTAVLECRLGDCAVLCVGGRPASVPLYREVVERHGARFVHHDGGEEHSDARLDATLAAADLVICQTGCISHSAYWRVKEHCKRTGKHCVFVDNPSGASLKRALAALPPPAA